MFESGYARGVNTALGALDGMAWPGDLSPARSYLEDDLVPDRAAPPGMERPGAWSPASRPGPGWAPHPILSPLARLGASTPGRRRFRWLNGSRPTSAGRRHA